MKNSVLSLKNKVIKKTNYVNDHNSKLIETKIFFKVFIMDRVDKTFFLLNNNE